MSRAFELKPNNPAVEQPVHLHADLGGKILQCRAQAERLAADMRHVEAVIRMFDPASDVRRIAVRRRNQNRRPFKRGTTFRAAFGILREATGPLTSKEICTLLLAAKGIADPGQEQMCDMYDAVHRSLVNYEGKSVVKVGEGVLTTWRLAPD